MQHQGEALNGNLPAFEESCESRSVYNVILNTAAAEADDFERHYRKSERAPALVGLAIDPVASLVDTAMIGRFCTAADLAGVGVAVSIFNLLSRTFNFLSSSTTSVVAAASSDATAAGEFNAEMARRASAALAVAGPRDKSGWREAKAA